MTWARIPALLVAVVLVVLVGVACGGDDDASSGSPPASESATEDGGDVGDDEPAATRGDESDEPDEGDEPAATGDGGESDEPDEGDEPAASGDGDESDEPDDEEWSVALDDAGVGIHTVSMIKTFSPLEEADIEDLGGRLVWGETEFELCRIGIRSVGDGFVQIGDIFQTSEECDGDTGMQQAVDDLGPPDSACVFVRVDGVDDEYCAPLTVRTAEDEGEPLNDEVAPPASEDSADEWREVIDEAVPEGPAPAGLAGVVLPTDVDGVNALFEALPDELIGGVKVISDPTDPATPGDLAADYSVPDRASRYGFQATDLTTSFVGSILPEPRADMLVALFVLSDDDDYTVEVAGHDGDLYWVTLTSFNSGYGIDGVEEVYAAHWGEAGSQWAFMVGAPTEAGRDELLAAFIAAASTVPR